MSRNRLALISSYCQTESLEHYIAEFSRRSLMVPELDEHTRAMLFVEGMSDRVRFTAMREHPTNMTKAIRAARLSRLSGRGAADESGLRGRRRTGRRPDRPADWSPAGRSGSPADNSRGVCSWYADLVCFNCCKPGHIARNCPEPEQEHQHLDASKKGRALTGEPGGTHKQSHFPCGTDFPYYHRGNLNFQPVLRTRNAIIQCHNSRGFLLRRRATSAVSLWTTRMSCFSCTAKSTAATQLC